jgi:hypothetical protein
MKKKPAKKPVEMRVRKQPSVDTKLEQWTGGNHRHGDLALAEGTWNAAVHLELAYVDIIGACSILVQEIARKTGEPVGVVMLEVTRRLKGA